MGLKGVNQLVQKLERIEKVNRMYPYRAGVIAVNFSKDRFRQQNWIDNSTEPWKRRQLNPGGRGTLIGKGSGSLMRRTRIVSHNQRQVIIGNDHPAAEAHNEGMKIMITEKMRKFFWAKYYELSGGVTFNIRTRKKTAKGERLSKEAEYYRNMALTKKKYITIPRRQFMGQSVYMRKQIERQQTADYAKALKGN